MGSLSFLQDEKMQLENTRKQLQDNFKNSISDIFKNFLNENPQVKLICWAQYTPYFNDGEECVFGIGEITAYGLKDSDVDFNEALDAERGELLYGENDEDSAFVPLSGYYSKDGGTTDENVIEFITALGAFEDEFKYAFGDHCSVWVTNAGVDVQEYDHD